MSKSSYYDLADRVSAAGRRQDILDKEREAFFIASHWGGRTLPAKALDNVDRAVAVNRGIPQSRDVRGYVKNNLIVKPINGV